MVYSLRWLNRRAHLGNDCSVTTGHKRFTFLALQVRLKTVSPWGWAVLVMCIAHATWMSWIAIDLHNGLGTFSYDVGLYDQGVWLMSRGHAPFVTLMGRNLLGDHASLILVLLIPLYWIVPSTITLLVVQAIVVAGGAIPMYLLAQRILGNRAMAFCAAFLWLANPALNGGAMENFHPDSFLALFIPLVLFAAFSRKWKLFAVAVLLSLLVKEDVLLLMVPLGLYVAWRFDRRKGLLTALASVVVTALGMFVMMKHLIGVPTRNAWRIPYGGPMGFMKELVTNPLGVGRYLLSEGRAKYLFQMAVPFGGLFLASPWIAAIALPVIASNIASTFWYQHNIQYHYSIIAIAPLLVATLFAISSLGPKWGRVAMATVVSCTLATFLLWGIHPLAMHPRQSLTAGSPFAQAGLEIIKEIPSGAVVSAYDPLTTHLGHRQQIYFFPNPFKALYYGVDDSLEGKPLPEASEVEYVVLPRALGEELLWDWSEVSNQFSEIDSNQYWQLFRRVKP